MAKLGNGWKAKVDLNGEKVTFDFREATNKEINEFKDARYQTKGKKMNDKSHSAREDFFDKLCTGVHDLEDASDQPITLERISEVPAHWKHDIIFSKYEDNEIDIKN